MTRESFDNAVTEFSHAIGLLVRRLRANSALQGLSWTESSVMKRLAKEGPATTADLARAEGMRPQSMRTVVASLEETGIVERRPHPTDGRQVNIALTAKGASAQKSSGDARRTWLTQAIARLDDEEREALFTAGRIIGRMAK